MEGIAGDHSALEHAMSSFGRAYLAKVEAEMRKPAFRRAQMGFNNNIKFKNTEFHVQTEDSGLDAPHIITHLFADSGRVIKSHKRSYEAEVRRPDIAEFVRGLMKAQHLEMVMKLREGGFDKIIAGEAIGGMGLLSFAPSVDILKLKKKKDASDTDAAQASPVDGRARVLPAACAPQLDRRDPRAMLRAECRRSWVEAAVWPSRASASVIQRKPCSTCVRRTSCSRISTVATVSSIASRAPSKLENGR